MLFNPPLSGRDSLWLLGLGYPCSSSGAEETPGLHGGLHPNVALRVSPRYETGGSPDALGPDRHVESSSPAAYLYRSLNHRDHLYSSRASSAVSIAAGCGRGIGLKNGCFRGLSTERHLGLKS